MLLKEHITFGEFTKKKIVSPKKSPQIELSKSPENFSQFSLREQHKTSPGYLLKC